MAGSAPSILIVRLSAIGDVVHTLPALPALRARYPEARIGWLVEELSAPLLDGYPGIDDLIVIPKKDWRARPLGAWLDGGKPRFYRDLRRRGWDWAIDFQGLSKSGWAARLSGARRRVGYGDHDGRELNKLFTTDKVRPRPEAVHVIRRNLELLRPLGIDAAPVAWDFPRYGEAEAAIAPFVARLGGPGFVAWNPGAGWETKQWPPGHFGRAARLVHEAAPRPQLMVWGPGEEPLCRAMREAAGLPEEALLMAPATNLRELATLLRHAGVLVAGDTGPMHLAAALGTRCVALHGATDPMRNGPWGERHRVFWDEEAPCVGCWQTRCTHEPRLDCLERLAPEDVARAILEEA